MTRADYLTRCWVDASCEVCDAPAEARVEAVEDRLEVTDVHLPECGGIPEHGIDEAAAIDEAARILARRLESAATAAAER